MGELVQNFGPTVTVLLLVIFMLIRDRKNGKPEVVVISEEGGNPGNPGTLDMVIGGMNEKLTGIKDAVQELDKGGWERHHRMRETLQEQTEAIVELKGVIEPMDERIKGLVQ